MLFSMDRHSKFLYICIATLAVLALAACGGGGEGGGGEKTEGGATVNVKLTEYTINADRSSAKAGEVTFELQNIGGFVHEFVVIKTDLALTDLPTADDGSVNEEAPGMEVVDEVEDIPAGGKETLKVDLQAGKYVLVCNVVEASQGAHYKHGMRLAFTVS